MKTADVFSYRLAMSWKKRFASWIADFVDDEHPVLGQDLELVRQAVLEMGLLELLNELVAVDVVGRETVPRRHQA